MATEHMEFTAYPVIGWTTGPVHERGEIALRIKYMDMATQQQAETPFFGLPRPEVQNLIDSLTQALAGQNTAPGGS